MLIYFPSDASYAVRKRWNVAKAIEILLFCKELSGNRTYHRWNKRIIMLCMRLISSCNENKYIMYMYLLIHQRNVYQLHIRLVKTYIRVPLSRQCVYSIRTIASGEKQSYAFCRNFTLVFNWLFICKSCTPRSLPKCPNSFASRNCWHFMKS